jgi:hypothetical protein
MIRQLGVFKFGIIFNSLIVYASASCARQMKNTGRDVNEYLVSGI